jgi:hypothetical protein
MADLVLKFENLSPSDTSEILGRLGVSNELTDQEPSHIVLVGQGTDACHSLNMIRLGCTWGFKARPMPHSDLQAYDSVCLGTPTRGLIVGPAGP